MVTVRSPAPTSAVSPLLIVRDVVNDPNVIRLPPVRASRIPQCVIVPQLAVAVTKVSAVALEPTPFDGALKVMAKRAYAPPLTSVPELASVGSLVYNPK